MKARASANNMRPVAIDGSSANRAVNGHVSTAVAQDVQIYVNITFRLDLIGQ